MPIFHEPDDILPRPPPAHASSPLQDTERAPKQSNGPDTPLLNCMSLHRVDLIERLKRVNSPPCQPVSFTTSSCSEHRHGLHPKHISADSVVQEAHRHDTPESRPPSQDRPKTPLLSTHCPRPSPPCIPDSLRDHASAGLEIARPRSALHSGDFREKKEEDWCQPDQAASPLIPLATSPVVPWHHSFPTAARPSSRAVSPPRFHEAPTYELPTSSRTRAISQSSFSSFAFLPPTSPLVQQSNNTDLDMSSRPSSRQSSRSPERSNRRRAFSHKPFKTSQANDLANLSSIAPAARHVRKAAAAPYQAHQPRRSLTSLNHFQTYSNPQTPLLGSRRPSFSSEASPLHHAPMVGSYEESILRGRMSTTPSRPLNFIAKIGVLGRGQCKSNLKCPPHVAVPFPAVFYSYNTENGRISDDSPSPYVGLVDLENSITSPEESSETSKRKRRHTIPDPGHNHLDMHMENDGQDSDNRTKKDLRRKEKKKRRSTSPKTPPGGSYRIPQQGQLQIVIKNPNKTAVKLFLVPYDLSDMEPGQKTFIRQRSYSAGPIIDQPLSSRKNLGTDRPEASLSNSEDPNDRPILRYLIHLHICCPSKGRYYLYKSIRVVFANRVPDGKEKLRNEIQMPEPRYSTYKSTRDSLASQTPSSAAAQLTFEKDLRRRSAGLSLSQHPYSRTDSSNPRHRPQLPPPAVRFTGSPSPNTVFTSPISTMEPIPFALTRNPSTPSQLVSRDFMEIDLINLHNRSGYISPTTSDRTNSQKPDKDSASFGKLSKGDVGYGGNAFSSVGGSPISPAAGLLTRRLRGLDVDPEDDLVP